MTRTALIGITTYTQLPGQYADAVHRAGGIPLLIQPGEPRMRELMTLLDGLILSGGGDVDPVRYTDADYSEIVDKVDQERDGSEFELVELALESTMPLFYICLGHQVLNIALRGTLIPHIPDAVPHGLDHRQPPGQPNGYILHPIQIDDDARLAQIFRNNTVTTASWHHQAIDKVAPGLKVVGRAADGIIEAVEMSDKPHVFAVQWHSELIAAKDESQQRLFDELVKMARARKK